MVITSTVNRNILVLKGLTFGIPPHKVFEAIEKACEIFDNSKITTIVFDGDKERYLTLDDMGSSFTAILKTLIEKYPKTEVIFFKNKGRANGLIYDTKNAGFDEYGNLTTAYKFLTKDSTNVYDSELFNSTNFPQRKNDMHYGIEFDGVNGSWDRLGLAGLEFVKKVLGVNNVVCLHLGEGYALKQENKKVEKDEDDKYPTRHIHLINIERKESKLNILNMNNIKDLKI